MSLNFSSFNLKKLNTNNEPKNNSSSLLSLAFYENEEFGFLSNKKLFIDSSDESTEQSSKSLHCKNHTLHTHLFKEARKDLYGNIIEKGGKYKVSFKDDIKGQVLVQMTFYDSKDVCLKSKINEKYTINREARDKMEMACCNIF